MARATTRSRGKRWHNWSGSVRCAPRELATPRSIEELAALIGEYGKSGRRVRVLGSGHSFTPLVASDDVHLSMAGLRGITAVDEARGTVTVLGGTPLRELGAALLQRGLAQENLGDIDVQTITGAISTGTHGTGVRFGTLATQVSGLTLVTAAGDVHELSAERDPDAFKAAQVSLGALGVLAAVTLRVVPAKRLHYQTRRERLPHVMEHLERSKQDNSHFEFFWFPYTQWTQAKYTNETTAQPTGSNLWSEFNRVALENGLFGALSGISRRLPFLSRTVGKLSAAGIASTSAVDYSHRIFATPRVVRFLEMEYNLPAERFPAAIADIQALLARRKFAVHFPIECRFVKGDDIWLSPAYARDSAYIAVHMYKGMPYERYFGAMEEILRAHDGRPHWGKMHTMDAATLGTRYPHWHDFRRVRAQLDPNGLFLNDYLRRLLDSDGPVPPPPASAETSGIGLRQGDDARRDGEGEPAV
jgi:FAD-linked oxidoreductase